MNYNSLVEETLLYNIEPKSVEEIDPISDDIMGASKAAFIDSRTNCKNFLMPKLLINDNKKGIKVLNYIESQLKSCNEFMISVAFITSSGLITLIQILDELKNRGIKGRIITTDYLNFSEPKALRKLLSFSNISVRVYTKEEFHTKGYIFKYDDYYKFVVGSSNLTQKALTKNKEWNVTVSSLENGALSDEVLNEFKFMWKDSIELTEEWISSYEELYRQQRSFAKKSLVPRLEQYKLKPNRMQAEAICSLKNLRENHKEKALLISATGTGKTYLSAFDVREFNPKRALFIVHREQIARQAMESYRNVFGDTRTMGILSGVSKEVHCDFIFCTVQTLSKEETLGCFKPDEFDYIVIDEVHKAGASSYHRIFEYFKPKFLLGMTATPERNDDFNIFELFDYNIAYEIRLKQALENDLLCPFHYFGISDINVDGVEMTDNTEFRYLVQDERVEHIIEKINFYGYYGDRVKGLVFCSNKNEARELSIKFNERGYRTLALTGDDSQSVREEAIERVEQDSNENALDYIFTVDIFNEGVDIPVINQVVMLRPTKSSIIFVQQLGRGLRKNPSKEYVVVIDFVGNYNNNFMIPIALSGDRTYNKDNIRRYVVEGSRIIPGCSTINFDEVARKRIFEAIDKANFSEVKLIKEKYIALKNKIGYIPSLMDFERYDEIDPLRIFENKSLGTYHRFLCKYDEEYKIKLDDGEQLFIEFISKKLCCGKRPHELLLIKLCLEQTTSLMGKLKLKLMEKYNISFTSHTELSVVNMLTNEFPVGTGKKTYEKCIFIEKYENDYRVSSSFKGMLENRDFKNMVNELVDFGLNRFEKQYINRYMSTNFTLYEKYTYEDVCWLLEWEKCEVATNIGGYKFNSKTKTYPVFINYDKDDDIQASINYHDRFLSQNEIIAISKSGRSPESPDVRQAYSAERDHVCMHLFVRKNKDDKISKEFYYLGRINTVGTPNPIIMKEANKKAVEIKYILHTAVRDDIYEYICS
ncbi:Helicase conserved C-terminal domain-containing protein [Hathewaya proteolytica DSM 3090]|uniref:Helicase conserved C-terminal domain-containing protein n=1 Tax=Hathewaya proteolytica DSM 3090 TaxID=1121331 RepID=A0A1M6QLA1_9CLOT|nr:DEAD/DEAH box helicase [Hathewaya proteolytica]SHK20880.1 Helicase conserved C-terminal domain-containing protein [Hathewaya proteolytica DSM 3090]